MFKFDALVKKPLSFLHLISRCCTPDTVFVVFLTCQGEVVTVSVLPAGPGDFADPNFDGPISAWNGGGGHIARHVDLLKTGP